MIPVVAINDRFGGIELSYSQKPDKEILEVLHTMGFKWSPKQKHWYKADVGGSLAGWLKNKNFNGIEFAIIFRITEAAKDYYQNEELSWLYSSLQSADLSDDEVLTLNISPSSKQRIAGLAKLISHAGGGARRTGEDISMAFATLSGLEVYPEDQDPYLDEPDGPGLGKAIINDDVYKIITDMVIKTIESKKNLVWRKPWASMEKYGLAASNYVSKKAYRGANAFLLNFIIPMILKREWDIPYFLTFKQIEKLGGTVKKGTKGYIVTYFQVIRKKGDQKISESQYWDYDSRCKKGAVMEGGVNVCNILKSIPVLRYYKVFNAEDIEGISFKLPKIEPRSEFERIATAEAILQNFPSPKPEYIAKDPDGAWYAPGTDQLNMPPEESFESEQAYYSTSFHEHIHSTGHKKRLDRDLTGRFGTTPYRFEELIAELGATFLCGESGILYFTLNNSAAYLKSYKESLVLAMKKDPKFFFKAASKAQAAADFILQRDEDGIPKYLSSMRPKENPSVKKETSRKARQAIRKVKYAKMAGLKTFNSIYIHQGSGIFGSKDIESVFDHLFASLRNVEIDMDRYYNEMSDEEKRKENHRIKSIIDNPKKLATYLNKKSGVYTDDKPNLHFYFPAKHWDYQLKKLTPLKAKEKQNAVKYFIEITNSKTTNGLKGVKDEPVLDAESTLPLSRGNEGVPIKVTPLENEEVPKNTPSGRSDDSATVNPTLKELGAMTGGEIMATHFDTLPFNGPWGDFMQTPGANLSAVIYGRPKNGKTTFSFQFADYLSGFGPVGYVLADQGIKAATQDLIRDMKLERNDEIHFLAFRDMKNLERLATSGVKFIFIDLINNFQIGAEEMEVFMHRHPDIGMILVMESTKAGDFRGEQKWTHIVDAIIRVENWVAYNTGRYGSGEYSWPKPIAV